MNYLAFLGYLGTAIVLLVAFMKIYIFVTPYNEITEIQGGNIAASIALGGAMVGFTLPLVSVIYFTHSYTEMLQWAVITGIVQLTVFKGMEFFYKCADAIITRNVAGGVFLASMSIAIGLLNAVSVSW